MTRRHSGSAGGWDVRTYRSPLWKYAHPVKYLKAEARKARRDMNPLRVASRGLSINDAKSALRTTTKRVDAQTRQRDVQRAQAAATRAAKKTTATKTASKQDPYAVALAIPEKNRRAGAQIAKAAAPKKAAPMSERAIRGKGGKLAGSRPALSADDQEAYQRAKGGYVDPVLRPRGARRGR